MYDFDKLFTDFIKSKGHVHEEDIGETYEEWLDTFCASLDSTPREKIDSMTDEMLVKELKDECAIDSPSLIVMENLEKRKPIELLCPLLYEDNETLAYCAAELLYNMNEVPYAEFAELLPSTDGDMFELIIRALKEDPEAVREKLYEIAYSGNERLKTVAAEILIEGKRDERTYKLLSELFSSGDNLPLYAGYMARYGDERAVAMLYRALNTASYADYIEIRNAIESLGGIVDDDRDFSDDPEYMILRGKKNG